MCLINISLSLKHSLFKSSPLNGFCSHSSLLQLWDNLGVNFSYGICLMWEQLGNICTTTGRKVLFWDIQRGQVCGLLIRQGKRRWLQGLNWDWAPARASHLTWLHTAVENRKSCSDWDFRMKWGRKSFLNCSFNHDRCFLWHLRHVKRPPIPTLWQLWYFYNLQKYKSSLFI